MKFYWSLLNIKYLFNISLPAIHPTTVLFILSYINSGNKLLVVTCSTFFLYFTTIDAYILLYNTDIFTTIKRIR